MKETSHRHRLLVFILILGVVFVARYFRFAEFGLYEDDLTRIPTAMTMTWSALGERLLLIFQTLGGQGRPFHDALIFLLASLLGRLGALDWLYVGGFLLLCLNAYLFYLVMERVTNQGVALLAAIVYILFPADTTQIYLTHSFGVQPVISAFLFAMLAYLSGRRLLAYTLMLVPLFGYETLFLPFLVVPWLVPEERNKGWTFLKRHAVVIAGLLMIAFVARYFIGETRVLTLSLADFVRIPVAHMIQGAAVSLGSHILRPIQVLQQGEITRILLSLGSAIAIEVVLLLSSRASKGSLVEMGDGKRLSLWRYHMFVSPEAEVYLWPIAVGAAMILLAYPLTFTVRAYAISGRDTRVHLAAVFGNAMLISTTIAFLHAVLRRKVWKQALLGMTALVLGFLVGFSTMVQADYADAWRSQQNFWRQAVSLVDDAGDGVVVLVEPEGFLDTRHIGANTWNMPRILNQLYNFPEEWEPPRVYRLAADWEDRILTTDGQMQLNAATTIAPPSLYRSVAPEEVILLAYVNGQLTRREAELVLPSLNVGLRLPGESVLALQPKGILYDLMLEGEG